MDNTRIPFSRAPAQSPFPSNFYVQTKPSLAFPAGKCVVTSNPGYRKSSVFREYLWAIARVMAGLCVSVCEEFGLVV